MDGQRHRALLFIALILQPLAAEAFSFAPITDGSLADQADAVILARVADVAAQQDADVPRTRYRLHVEQRVKGALFADDISVVIPGGTIGDRTLRVSGAPRLATDERVLMFLAARGDGSFAPVQLALGTYRVRTTLSGHTVALRDLTSAQVISPSTGASTDAGPDRLRDLGRFMAWLHARARGLLAPPDYWLADEALAEPAQGKYQLPPAPIARWPDFDEGRTVTMYASSSGLQGLAGGGYTQFQQALDAWTADPGSNVQLAYGGTTSASAGLSQPDGVSAIQFNDQNNLLSGSFDCLNGGVAATTGTWVGREQRWSEGRYLPIVEADIVVQDGASCLLGLIGGANAAELFAHELGHALGLAHSCGEGSAPACTPGSAVDEALMRPKLHADGRGATLQIDDRNGIDYLYPLAAPPQDVGGGPSGDASTSPGGGGGGGGGAMGRFALLCIALLATLRRHAANSARLLPPPA